MKDTDFARLTQWQVTNNFLFPVNERAEEVCQNEGEIVEMQVITPRDGTFHRLYFELLSYIWKYQPDEFKREHPKESFYNYLKGLQRHYKRLFRFPDEITRNEIRDYLLANKKEFRLTYKSIARISERLGFLTAIEFDSISYARMNEQQFREYFKSQLPYIYEHVIYANYADMPDLYESIISNLEADFERSFLKYKL